MNIPPAYTGYRKNLNIVNKLRNMAIGESIKLPKSAWNTIHSCTKLANVKVVTRTLGNKKTVIVWRVE